MASTDWFLNIGVGVLDDQKIGTPWGTNFLCFAQFQTMFQNGLPGLGNEPEAKVRGMGGIHKAVVFAVILENLPAVQEEDPVVAQVLGLLQIL